MSDLIFVGIIVAFFVARRSLRAFLREAVGPQNGNNHRRDYRVATLRLSARGNDSTRKILGSIWKHPVGFNLRLFLIALALITKPMGLYLVQVLDPNGRTWLDPVLRPLERHHVSHMGVKPEREHNLEAIHARHAGVQSGRLLFTYAILRLQNLLPLNPQGFAALSPDLAFNTAASFTTNTNWQSYGGESTMSYFSQMVGADVSQFRLRRDWHCHCRRAGSGNCAAYRQNDRQFLGRSGSRHLLPAAADLSGLRSVLVSQGMIQNFKPYTKATLVEPMKIPVEKKNDQGETIKRPDGKPSRKSRP